MFLEYRIRKLTVKLSAQIALVDQLEKAEKEYGSVYYTNRLLEAVYKKAYLSEKLVHLMAKAAPGNVAADQQEKPDG